MQRGFLLEVAIIDAGDQTIKVVHQFYGTSVKEVETYKREHLESCDYFRSAEHDGRTLEAIEEIDVDELPTPENWEEDEEET